MREHEITKTDTFIGGWYLDDDSLCERIIAHMDASPDKYRGVSSKDGGVQVDLTLKDSWDLTVWEPSLLQDYMGALCRVIDMYVMRHPYSAHYGYWGFTQDINIQFYAPGGGFHEWHTERGTAKEPAVSRHLVFLTYLNDVTDAGETEFFHQKIKVKPERGLTLIWPVDWTHTHRGVASPTQAKYIVTGWLNFKKA